VLAAALAFDLAVDALGLGQVGAVHPLIAHTIHHTIAATITQKATRLAATIGIPGVPSFSRQRVISGPFWHLAHRTETKTKIITPAAIITRERSTKSNFHRARRFGPKYVISGPLLENRASEKLARGDSACGRYDPMDTTSRRSH
jgi:hypothetical protein